MRLLDADPDLGRFLTPDERGEAAVLTVPVVHANTGPLDADALLERNAAFGAFIVEGMLACHLRVGEQAGMRILGPGDILSFGAAAPSMILVERGCRVVVPAQLALLGRDLLVGAHRWPRLSAGLHVRAAEQIERIAVQLAICQLPRVEDRLLALLWLLAESWGRVTPSGTTLPINLTHETLGALIGARRPTVTLALGELTTRGAVLRQGRTWLLLERPPIPTGSPRAPHAPEPVAERSSPWELPVADVALTAEERAELAETVQRLRKENAENAELLRRRLEEIRDARERNQQLRSRVGAGRPVRPRPAPS
jgi:CRP/FNR family transcriptional regulator, cyclic AMP receptor protein